MDSKVVHLCIIFFSFKILLSNGINTDKAQLINDLIDSYQTNIAYKIIHYSCTKDEAANIMLTLSKTRYYVCSSTYYRKPLPYYIPNNHLFYVVDLSCDYTNKIITEADDRNLFNEPHHWILLNFNNINITEVLEDVDALVDSDVILVKDQSNGSYALSRVYKLKEKLQLNYEMFGIWTKQGLYFQPNFINDAAVRRRNLHGTCLNTCIVITHNSSLNHLTDKREKHIDSIAKVNYVFTQHIGDLLNASMIYSIEPTWGYKVNNSHWTGMIGELTTHRADIGGTALFLTSDRVSIIDYIAMTTPTRSKFVFRQPKLSYITNVFTLPFETSVWISSGALVAITAFGLYLVIKWEWYKKRVYVTNNDDKHTETELQDSFLDVTFLAVGAICQQGASAVPYNTAGRVITLLLFTSLMFLYTSYSANIVALLQSSSTSIQTLADLLHSRMLVGVDDTVFNHFYFPNASEPVRRALYLQKVVPPGQAPRFFAIEEGVRRMRDGLFAFHMETGAGYKIVGETFLEDEKCDLEEIQFLQVPDPWFAIQKNSSYKEMLKIGLRKIQESGIQTREVSLLYTKKPVCSSRGSSFIGVGIVDCYPAALVLVVGAVISFSIFITELLYFRLFGKQKNASEPVRRALYLQKVVPPGQAPRFFAIEEGVRRMRDGLFAFHMETGAGYKIVGETFLEDEKCDLEEIQFLQVPDPWFAIQKNSSYKEMLKIGLRKIQESGIQTREVSLLYTKKPVCSSRGSSFIGVGIVDCYPAALVLVVGAVISFSIFITELLYFRLFGKQKVYKF